ncbi:MAG: hypothetical protein V5B34_11070 [Accumulibacter sp.]|jgi:hypothetical protein
MPIRADLWKVSATPQPLPEAQLASEKKLEDMIVAAPKLLSDEWMLICPQEDTGFGGRIDPPAIAPDGALVLIDLKRDKSPRDVVAQSLEYASWVEKTARRGHRRHLRPLRPRPVTQFRVDAVAPRLRSLNHPECCGRCCRRSAAGATSVPPARRSSPPD